MVMTGGNQLSMIMIVTREKKTEYPIVSSCIQREAMTHEKTTSCITAAIEMAGNVPLR